jgi:hypothetical protein
MMNAETWMTAADSSAFSTDPKGFVRIAGIRNPNPFNATLILRPGLSNRDQSLAFSTRPRRSRRGLHPKIYVFKGSGFPDLRVSPRVKAGLSAELLLKQFGRKVRLRMEISGNFILVGTQEFK